MFGRKSMNIIVINGCQLLYFCDDIDLILNLPSAMKINVIENVRIHPKQTSFVRARERWLCIQRPHMFNYLHYYFIISIIYRPQHVPLVATNFGADRQVLMKQHQLSSSIKIFLVQYLLNNLIFLPLSTNNTI
jgi:hypothetical protein